MGTGLNKKSISWDILCVLPGILFLLSILLVRLHLFSMPMTDVYWSDATDASTMNDLFVYWKAIVILFSAFLAAFIAVVGYFAGKIRFKKSLFIVPLLIYLGFSIISSLASHYRYFAIRGMSEHFEGLGVICAYMLMVVFLFAVLDSERRIKIVLYAALVCAVLLGILGITQATGHDFLQTVAGQKLITPNYTTESGVKSWDLIEILAMEGKTMYGFVFQSGEVYQTVYNINYVSFYLTLLIPFVALIFIYHFTDTKPSCKVVSIIFLATFGLLVFNFFAANSASGYFGLLAIFIAALIVFRKELKKWVKPLLCLIIVVALIMGVLADRWLLEIKSLIGDTLNTITASVYADNAIPSEDDFENDPASVWIPIDSVETSADHVYFGINGSAIVIARDAAEGAFTITDENGDPLYLSKIEGIEGKEGDFQILDERFHDYVVLSLIRAADGMVIDVTTMGADWFFLYDGNTFRYVNAVGKHVDLSDVPHSSLIKDYSFGSYRGRIWATTIPMLKKYLLLGAGADCFTFAFPQNDYVTLYNQSQGNEMTLVTDKVHNLYMQYWVNTGLISLLAWLAVVGFYLVGAVRSFRKRGFVDFCDFVNGGIFCGIIGFLVTAFFNDGSVNTMPMFYTMLATGLAINARDTWGVEEASVKSGPAQMPEI